MTTLQFFLLMLGLLTSSSFAAFALVSLGEKHRRAARLSAGLGLLTLLVFAAALAAPPTMQALFTGMLLTSALLAAVSLIWPVRADLVPPEPPAFRVDERTILFARARLEPDTKRYRAYYAAHPDHRAPDDAFRANPGLLQPEALFYDPDLAAAADGGFFLTEALREAVDGPLASRQTRRSPEHNTRLIKGLAAYHGAASTGICQLQPYHIYSHIGRGSGTYGAPITLEHRYAVAFSVEMEHGMVNAAPRMPAVIESARQYASAGKIAVVLAAAIRALGYPAQAHIDGNYRVIASLVARESGLGEIGRMGLLMTPRYGPRVRLGVVTTNLPLAADTSTWDPAVIDFCTHCQKCAVTCPAQAIPQGERKTQPDGTLRWKLDAERCYTYWTRIGTDCGRCMAVCPYSHANNIFHNLVRFGVSRSALFRRAAILLDDLFYSKKPLPHPPPGWLDQEV